MPKARLCRKLVIPVGFRSAICLEHCSFRLLKRDTKRASGGAAYEGIDEPPKRSGDISAESERFQLDIHSAVPLFKPGNAEQPSDQAASGVHGRPVFIGQTVVLDLTNLSSVRDAVPLVLIQPFVSALEVNVKRKP